MSGHLIIKANGAIVRDYSPTEVEFLRKYNLLATVAGMVADLIDAGLSVSVETVA